MISHPTNLRSPTTIHNVQSYDAHPLKPNDLLIFSGREQEKGVEQQETPPPDPQRAPLSFDQLCFHSIEPLLSTRGRKRRDARVS